MHRMSPADSRASNIGAAGPLLDGSRVTSFLAMSTTRMERPRALSSSSGCAEPSKLMTTLASRTSVRCASLSLDGVDPMVVLCAERIHHVAHFHTVHVQHLRKLAFSKQVTSIRFGGEHPQSRGNDEVLQFRFISQNGAHRLS